MIRRAIYIEDKKEENQKEVNKSRENEALNDFVNVLVKIIEKYEKQILKK